MNIQWAVIAGHPPQSCLKNGGGLGSGNPGLFGSDDLVEALRRGNRLGDRERGREVLERWIDGVVEWWNVGIVDGRVGVGPWCGGLGRCWGF